MASFITHEGKQLRYLRLLEKGFAELDIYLLPATH